MNKKGMTLVEIIVAISLVSVVMVFLFQVLITVKNGNDRSSVKSDTLIATSIITKEVEHDLDNYGLISSNSIKACDNDIPSLVIPSSVNGNYNCVELEYNSVNGVNNGYIMFYKNKNGVAYLAYKRYVNKENEIGYLETQIIREVSGNPKVSNNLVNIKSLNQNDYSVNINIPLGGNELNEYSLNINYISMEDSSDNPSDSNNEYTVTFLMDDGITVIETQKVKENETATKPSNPIKDSYTFKEWQLNGEIFNFNSTINHNIDLIAVFDRNITCNSFSSDDWSIIANNVRNNNTACYHVGDTKQITIDGRNYTLRIANMAAPAECSAKGFSQTACGFVVEFADIYYGTDATLCTYYDDGTCMMNTTRTNAGGWPSAPLRTYLNSKTNTNSIYNKLKSVIGDIIIDTYVVSGHGSSDQNYKRSDGNWESTDKVYLFSAGEVYANALTSIQYDTASFPYSGSGATTTRQLDYYAGKTAVAKTALTTSNSSSSTVNNSIKYLNDTAQWWWLRAANSNSNHNFRIVYNLVNLNDARADGDGGVAPAFRIG